MESIATVLYLRLRNVLAICNGMAPERAAALGAIHGVGIVHRYPSAQAFLDDLALLEP